MSQTSQSRATLRAMWSPIVYDPYISYNQPYFEDNANLTLAERTQLAIPTGPPVWPPSPPPPEEDDDEEDQEDQADEGMEDESQQQPHNGMEWSQTFFQGVDDLDTQLRSDGPSDWQGD
jgi:hypothetical protein